MWVLVFFDLPTETRTERKAATRFSVPGLGPAINTLKAKTVILPIAGVLTTCSRSAASTSLRLKSMSVAPGAGTVRLQVSAAQVSVLRTM